MKYFIITGASKGLGLGIATALAQSGHHLLCISRTDNPNLEKLTRKNGGEIDFFSHDLSNNEGIPGLMKEVFQKIDTDKARGIFLVNNAGVVQPVARLEDAPAGEIEAHIRINLIAPMLITSAYISHTQHVNTTKRILNISSGAAHNPYYGWSSYCAGKAGLALFTRCISEEQKDEPFPVLSMSVAPGIIDTDMQTVIRSTRKRDFVHKDKFVEFKEQGQLINPSLAGEKLADLLLSDVFQDGAEKDIRDTY